MKLKDLFPKAKSVREREEQLDDLVMRANQPAAAITITINGAGVIDFGLTGMMPPQTVLRALELTRDEVLKELARSEAQQEEQDGPDD